MQGIRRGRARERLRTPLFPQLETSECGAACLGVVLAHFGRWETIEELRRACGVSRDGSSAADIVTAAEQYGLRVTGWRKQISELRGVPLPAILFWEFNHFVVLEGLGRGVYYLNDPANGRRKVGEETFNQAFTGVVLVVERGPDFQPGGAPPGIVGRLWTWLRDVKGPLAFAALCGLLLALPGLALPLFLSVFVDYVLGGSETSWGAPLIAATAAAGALVYLLMWMQQRTLRRLAIRLSVVHAERLLSHLFRLPVQYFSHRFAGDLTSRVQLLDEVAIGSSRQFVGITIELVMSAFFLGLMLYYDPALAGIVAGLGIANVALMRVLTRARSDENRQWRREQALLFGESAFALRAMDSLRATASEDDFFARWGGYQARELVARQRFTELGYVMASLPRLFLILGGAAVLGFGGWRVISGDMTLGTLMAYYVLASLFLQPIGRFVQSADAFQVLEADLQRIDDVLEAPEEPAFEQEVGEAPEAVATLRGRLRLAGRIELRSVSFGYRPNHPPLIDDLSLTIEPGQRVAVIGPTGCGKSTLVKLLSGEYAPWSGEILLDGVPNRAVPRKVLTGSIGVVDQQIFLFSATVRDNLTMWNPTIPDLQLVAAAKDALIHDDIMAREAGYESRVDEGGSNFSGGQRQRLEIGRALVSNPSVLLLDEATSTLDAVSEMRIDDALRRRGCTCVIVAHRLSTIRDCDQILVLDRGRLVQRGAHEELIANEQGLYYQLLQAH